MNHAPLVKHKDYRRHVGISYNICLSHFVEKMKKWEEAFLITLIHHERIADFLSPLNHSLSDNGCNAMYMLRHMVYVTPKSQVLRCPWCLTLSLNELMMPSSNGNIFRVTGPLWITNASDTKLWCFLWTAPEQAVKQTIEAPVIWGAIPLIMTSL